MKNLSFERNVNAGDATMGHSGRAERRHILGQGSENVNERSSQRSQSTAVQRACQRLDVPSQAKFGRERPLWRKRDGASSRLEGAVGNAPMAESAAPAMGFEDIAKNGQTSAAPQRCKAWRKLVSGCDNVQLKVASTPFRESVKHDSNHDADNSENDGRLDQLFFQGFLAECLMINLIEHVSTPLSAQNQLGLRQDVVRRPQTRLKTL
jgi:hypothetical protein